MVKKLFFLVVALFLLSACQPNISVNYGNSNDNNNVNAVVNTNQVPVSPTPAPTLAGTITDVRISDVVNSQGVAEVNKTNFTKDTAEIFVSVNIQGAAAGLVATAELVYLPTGDKVGPVSNTISSSGDVSTKFSFTKPTNGWPSGNYNVNVSLSNGQKKTAPFIVP
jgi:hypothetical protein